ncbi:MAG: AAA family ATPase [Parabacteroides sp.]|nr:AAA family ATPase [bacterium]MDY4103152.1 AAA family ATPase [Parabacteroides sp.]
MGTYINRGNGEFRDIVTHEYVDKTSLIPLINATLNSENRYSCVTRCRRFGKSMAAKMLCAYYDKSCDSRELFVGLNAEKDKSFETYLNKYYVICIDMTDFTTKYRNEKDIVRFIQHDVMEEVLDVFPDIKAKERDDLMDILYRISERTGDRFVMIIDEWDAILREMGKDEYITTSYVDLLRRLFKGSGSNIVFAGAYLTGILPIKKYNTESALNNFCEYSMIDPAYLAACYGFTKDEVQELAKRHNASMEELKQWYDGYSIGREKSIYNPYSVMKALQRGVCKSYWSTTGAYDSVKTYIQMNFDGLKDDIIRMLAGERVSVRTTGFQNDMRIVNSKNDVLTVLIHLGYLAYDQQTNKCYIPNKEVADEMNNAVNATAWTQLAKALENSQNLLEATLSGDEQAVAQGIDLAHDEHTSILAYNDENSLACVLAIAYIWAKNEYIIHREYATGKGYADLVMIPRRNVSKPALVIELKFNQSTDTAIRQIKQKNYPAKLAEYTGDILLVGINYDKETKQHTCQIEQTYHNRTEQ